MSLLPLRSTSHRFSSTKAVIVFRLSNLALVIALFSPLALAPAINALPPAAAKSTGDAAHPNQLNQLGVSAWQAAGFAGKGVKVAVLDSGFRGYRDQLGKALPEHVTVKSFRRDGNLEAKDSQHGILCGEVIHTLAPDAQLLFANWEPDDPARFLDAVRWARKEGARVISCSVIMPCWSDGEGGGPVHEKLTRLLGAGDEAGDLLCFASAGNVAQRHWSGAFHDAGDGFHEWQAKQEDNLLSPWGGERVSVELCCGADSGYDVFVYDQETDREVGVSLARDHKGQAGAVVHFEPNSGHRYRVRVRLAEGKGGSFHLSALSAGLGCSTAKGSVTFPADGPEVLAVGAVNADGERMSYSACGPNSCQPKPDFVAPVPFASRCRSTPFAGTSAAAPQGAALAALCWSRYPDWTAAQVRSALRASARDLGPPGHDCETGYGMVQLPAVSTDLARLAREKDPVVRPKKAD